METETWPEAYVKCPKCSEETKFRYYQGNFEKLFEIEGLPATWMAFKDTATKTFCDDCGGGIIIPKSTLMKG